MLYFDFEAVARDAGISVEELERICRSIRQEFPRDKMMYELHVLRACIAIRDGHINLEDVIKVRSEKQQSKIKSLG